MSWRSRISSNIPSSLLLATAIEFFNDGLVLMRILCMKDLFKAHYHVEPSALQQYQAVQFLPNLCKPLFGLLIDAGIVKKRKNLIIGLGVICMLTQAAIFMLIVQGPVPVTAVLFLFNTCSFFAEAVIESMTVQQARSYKRGQQDMQMFNILSFGVGTALGSIIAAVCTKL